jgi:hypothetical protein
MWTAAQLVAQACEDAHVPGFVAQGQSKLQSILDTICYTRDYSSARGVYYFTLNPSLITSFGGFANFSGPYALPLDYLRTSGSTGSEGVQWSFFYVVSGVPYQLVPWDLGKMDQQVQFPTSQTYPWAYATDLATETTAQDRLAGTTSATTTIGSAQIEASSTAGMQLGMSVAGLGIAPGSTITQIGPLPPVASTTELIWDDPVQGTWDQNLWAPAPPTPPVGPVIDNNTVILSKLATGSFTGASIMFGTPAFAYIYPGPSGAFPATLRYQRLMPPLIDFNRIPWFPNQEILLERLTASLMSGADDARRETFYARADKLLGDYDTLSDDKTSRAQTVVMDANSFRSQTRRRLRVTKAIGW